MSRAPRGPATPDQIHEEPLRPLLFTVRAALENVLNALDAEYPDPDAHEDASLDPGRWTTPALAHAAQNLIRILDLHERALMERNDVTRHLGSIF